jgi:hypothetical protein
VVDMSDNGDVAQVHGAAALGIYDAAHNTAGIHEGKDQRIRHLTNALVRCVFSRLFYRKP